MGHAEESGARQTAQKCSWNSVLSSGACCGGKFVTWESGRSVQFASRRSKSEIPAKTLYPWKWLDSIVLGEMMAPGTANSTVLAGTAQASDENTLLYCYNTCPPDQ